MEKIHGSACFDSDKGTHRDIAFNGYNFLIGNSVVGASYGHYTDGNLFPEDHFAVAPPVKHLLSVAPTRSGKGVSLIIPNLLLYFGSAIVIDPKGENAWITAKHRREGMGHKTFILDPWGEVNRRYGDLAGELETIASFNPLSILDPQSENYADDIAYLADAIIINQGKDPHWDDSARELVAGLMAYLVETGGYATLSDVRGHLALTADEIRDIAQDARKLGPESLAARKLGRFAIDSRETASIVSTALTQTAFLDSATLAENMNESDFSFEDLINGQATIYLVLPVDKLQTYGRWLRLLVSIGIRTVARNVKRLPLPVLFVLDEFGTIGKLSAVSQAYGLMAGLQMTIWAFVQDLVQLKRDYPEEWETFIGNSFGVSCFSVMDQFTAEYFSRLLGQTTVEQISVATAKIREGGLLTSANPNYSAMADQAFGRALMQPGEIRSMRGDFGIFQTRGNPILFQRIEYYNEPFFLERARSDPHFPAMKQAKLKLIEEAVEEAAAREAKAALEEAKTKIPDWVTAKAFLEKRGYTLEDQGLLGQKTKITASDGKEKTFPNVAAVILWACNLLVKEKTAFHDR